MWYLSDERKKEEENILRKRIDEMTTDSEITVDMSSQKEYIINKKRHIMDLRSTLEKIRNLVREGIYKEIIIREDINKLTSLIDKVDTKLFQLEYSLDDEYEGLLLSSQWMEDNTTH